MPTRAYGRIVSWEGARLWVFGTGPGEGGYPKTALHAHQGGTVSPGAMVLAGLMFYPWTR